MSWLWHAAINDVIAWVIGFTMGVLLAKFKIAPLLHKTVQGLRMTQQSVDDLREEIHQLKK